MKKFYVYLGVLLCVVFGSANSYGQTITNVLLDDSCAGVQAYITIGPASANLSMVTYWGDGTNTSGTLTASQTKVYRAHGYPTAGTYSIKNVLLLSGVPIDSTINSYSNYCSYIRISTYADNNANCVQNTGEPVIYSPMSFEVDSAGTVIDTLSSNGYIYYKAKSGTVYKFKVLNQPLGSSLTCPSTGIATVTGPVVGTTAKVEFGFQCSTTSLFDLGVAMTGWFRPVNTSTLVIHAYNNACGSKSGVVTVNLSNKYKYKSANPTPASVTGNVFTWNVTNLSVTNKQTIYLYLDTNTTVSLSDTICNTAVITPITGDANTANNTLTQCDQVRTSWDPNDKHVYPAGDIMPGTKLTYTINFENLGNDTAFNISVLDTLSNNLDVSTFTMLHSSHAVSHLFLDGTGGQKIVRFDFADIHLADKNAPDYNKGFVQFSIVAKAGLTPLTQINNRAGIYFDINPVVLTNTAENRIKPTSIGKLEIHNNILIYPNPVTDVLTIKVEAGEYESLKLINNIGQVIINRQLAGVITQIDVKQLPAGLYYLLVSGKAGSVSHKVEKL